MSGKDEDPAVSKKFPLSYRSNFFLRFPEGVEEGISILQDYMERPNRQFVSNQRASMRIFDP